MMRAYDEQYLDDAMRNLGEAADYAVNACNMTLQKFFDLFVTTGFAAANQSETRSALITILCLYLIKR